MIESRTDFDPHRAALAADELRGRVVAITGPTAGIGHALALECARRGAEVVLIGRNVRKLEAVYDEIAALRTSTGASVPAASIAPLDLEKSVAGDYDAIAHAVLQRWGRLDGLVHNAAILGVPGPIEDYDVPTWVKVMHVNVTAVFALTQVLLPMLRASRDASVLCLSSGVGRAGRAYWGAYAASKFALEGFMQTLADELEKTTVRVNSLNPGPARTQLRRQAYPSEDAATLPLPETLTPPMIALLGPQSRGVTGQAF
ncbi:MAG: YciK family oxidoreductase [Gammaproteobacteria bacterium]|nr:YciK family oxidoreductase [Gammaproteobacteria bacterium]